MVVSVDMLCPAAFHCAIASGKAPLLDEEHDVRAVARTEREASLPTQARRGIKECWWVTSWGDVQCLCVDFQVKVKFSMELVPPINN